MAVIRKLANGKYQLDWRSGGKRHRANFDSRREAEEAKREVVLGISVDTEPNQREPKPLKDALRQYSDNVSKLKASHLNERDYLSRFYKSMRTQGIYFVHEITAEHIDAFKAERLKTCKGSTVNRELNTYRHFFATCVNWKWLHENPAKGIKNATFKKAQIRVWTNEEFEAVVGAVPRWAGLVLTTIRWTGAGPKEISALTWGDVDLIRGTLKFKRYKGTGEEFGRSIPMPPSLKEFILERHQDAKSRARAKLTDRVFVDSKGNPVRSRALSLTVRRATARLGLASGLAPYGLRHTFATELLEAGVGEDQVRRLMGHQDVRTLIENYSHVRHDALSRAMEERERQVAKPVVIEKSVTTGDQRNATFANKTQTKTTKRKGSTRPFPLGKTQK